MKTLAIMIGIQGSRKSTFCARYLSGLVRVNLDTLKTRNNEKRLIEKCFEEGVGFVVDNTNPTRADRARYIAPAKARGYRVIGYFMQSRLGDCIRRNNLRQGKERIPEKGIAATFRKLELPGREEGFDELYLVENDGADMTVSKWEEKTDSDAPRPKDPRP
ncbi:MAG: ATP-binding protein [Clostridia bacterium]|nr:ATP-binding protein [Clostridia bacterium]